MAAAGWRASSCTAWRPQTGTTTHRHLLPARIERSRPHRVESDRYAQAQYSRLWRHQPADCRSDLRRLLIEPTMKRFIAILVLRRSAWSTALAQSRTAAARRMPTASLPSSTAKRLPCIELRSRLAMVERQLRDQNVPLPPNDVLEQQLLERMIVDRVADAVRQGNRPAGLRRRTRCHACAASPTATA